MSLPSFCEPLSVCLSRVLEAVGVNGDTVRKRRQLYHEAEVIREMGFHLTKEICNIPLYDGNRIYHFGSKIEGSTTLGQKSDVDHVHIISNWKTILRYKSDRPNSIVQFKIDENDATPPGHCSICVVRKASINCQDIKENYYDSEGKEFLPNNLLSIEDRFSSCLIPRLKHGPSLYCNNTDNIMAIDLPPELFMTRKSISRFSSYYWPVKSLINKLRKSERLLVPIGHPESENARIEWRISNSFAERLLIFDFNITQLRCLVVLKMIKKTFFQPIVGDDFTSYHCKTTLFHAIARTRPSLWREDRLYHCIMFCLSTLNLFLLNHFCPHFFNQNVNLFIGKLIPSSCKRLSVVVKNLLNDNLWGVLQIKTDDLGDRILGMPALFRMMCFPSRYSIEKQMLVDIVYDRHRFLIEYSRMPYIHMYNSHPTLKKQIYAGFKLIQELMHIMKHGNGTENTVARLLLPHFAAKHASLISAYRIKKKQPITDDLIDMLNIGFQTDATSNRLKLASVLYCSGELRKAETILHEVKEKYSSIVLPTCFEMIFTFSFDYEEFYREASEALEVNRCRDAISSCVEYMRKDVWCIPLGLRRSLISVEHDKHDVGLTKISFGMEVDSKTMLYYLEYLTYAGLSSQLKTKALNNLMQCLVGNPYKWTKYFFELVTEDDKYIIDKYRDRVFANPDNYLETIHEAVTPKLHNDLKHTPFGSIRVCLCYALHRCSVVQHMDKVLMLIGYCFEREKNIDFASAFYWMSFLLEPRRVTASHILRVCPEISIYDYINNFYSDKARTTYAKKLEIALIPKVVEMFVNFLDANVSLGILTKDRLPLDSFRARVYVCILNALIRKYDRQKTDSSRCTKSRSIRQQELFRSRMPLFINT